MTTTYRTTWGSDTIEITADFAQASCPVEGTNGRQVAEFRHDPHFALRYALKQAAQSEGLDPDSDDVADLIEEAMAGMEESP